MNSMRTSRIPLAFAIVGISLVFMVAGCSSRQHTAVMSAEETQPQQQVEPDQETGEASEVTSKTEPPGVESETPTPEDTLSSGPAEVAMEEPMQGFIPPETSSETLDAPITPLEPALEGPVETESMPFVEQMQEPQHEEVSEPSTEATEMVESVPSVESEAELPPEPNFNMQTTPIDPTLQPADAPEIARLSPDAAEGELADVAGMSLTLTDIFFDFDQFTIRKDEITTLENNAKFLLEKYSDHKILIEGHCDERGTEEYNIVLGKRRAQAVKDYLVDLGIPEENLQVISFGKEKPFCTEHNPVCWQQNRRTHFVLK